METRDLLLLLALFVLATTLLWPYYNNNVKKEFNIGQNKPMTYVINLLSRPEQKETFTKDNESFLDLRFIEAVDGSKASKFHLQEKAGRYGCFLSHIKAWQMVANGEEEWVLVAEDDYAINPKIVDYFPILVGRANEVKADFVYLDNGKMGNERTAETIDVIPIKGTMVGTHLYMISKQGAKRLLNDKTIRPRGRTPIDIVLTQGNKYKLYMSILPEKMVYSTEFSSKSDTEGIK